MKKLSIVLFLAVVAASSSYAQDLKPFRFAIGGGYAIPFASGASGGINIGFEPSYRLKDNFSLGLRAEFAIVAKISGSTTGTTSVATIGSWTLNGQYYFGSKTEGFRPFAGAGVGIFSGTKFGITNNGNGNNNIDPIGTSTSDIGFYPRVGFDISHFTLNLDYNIVGNDNSYLGIRAAVQIGGGKK
jgi:outer membrane protein W